MNPIIIIIIAVVVIFGLYIIATRNNLVTLKNKAKDEYSQIDIQLKRRFDLIPNLVECVKGYAKHEKETLEEVINARNKCVSAGNTEDALKEDANLTKAVNKLFALAESYPELKANTNFEKLQDELSKTEDKITYARQFYNDSILSYNNKVELFPSSIVASIFGFKKESFFEASKEEKENIKVKF